MVKHSAWLGSRALLAVQGADAPDFLQGLISNDIRKVTPQRAIYAALLSPQGKYLFDFLILPWGDGFALDVASARADDLLKRLSMYKLRAQVTLSRLESIMVAARWGDECIGEAGSMMLLTSGALLLCDPRHARLGQRIVGTREQVEAVLGSAVGMEDENSYHAHRIALAVPEGSADMVVDKSLLMEFGFEPLHGVDFAKGCYVGQEVTARSKHRAQLRKALHAVSAVGDVTSLPPAGAELLCDGKPAGEMRSSAGARGLALLSLEAVRSGQPITCGDLLVQAHLPEWFDKALASAAD